MSRWDHERFRPRPLPDHASAVRLAVALRRTPVAAEPEAVPGGSRAARRRGARRLPSTPRGRIERSEIPGGSAAVSAVRARVRLGPALASFLAVVRVARRGRIGVVREGWSA